MGVAVNVTDVPAQMVLPGLAAILTEGVTLAFTVMVIPVEVAVAGEGQVAFEVITHVIISPFANEAFVYVVEFVPTLPPFNFH